MNRKNAFAAMIAAITVVLTLGAYATGLFDRVENLMYDAKVKLYRSGKKLPEKLKVILVDDASVSALDKVAGRLPWPRWVWADLLEFLERAGARMVLFDILFSERTDARYDAILVDATRTAGNVVHSMTFTADIPDTDVQYQPSLDRPLPEDFAKTFALRRIQAVQADQHDEPNNSYLLPIEALRKAAHSVAVVEFKPDADGVYRRTRLIRNYQRTYYPVLGLAPFVTPETQISLGTGAAQIGDRTIPLDRHGRFLVNMYRDEEIDPISFSGVIASLVKIREGDVENLPVHPEEFNDAIVFVGVSAIGGSDLKATPLSSRTPGVMLHVATAGNYMQRDFLRPPDPRITLAAAIIGIVLVTVVVFYSANILVRVLFPIVLLSAYVAAAFASFQANIIIEAAPFIFGIVASTLLSFGYQTFTEAAQRRRVSHLFSQYVSKDVLHEVLHNYKDYVKSSAGQKVDITVLFSDIRGFTTFSENTPPERIVEMLNTHFSKMAEIILKHNGTLDKYIGDAIMAFWGAPVPDRNHAENAVKASLEMLKALEEVNATLKMKGYEGFTLKIGIGLNSGEATIGSIGSEQKLNYTVVGDTVNLASRLESLTKEHNTALLISEYTHERIKDKIPCERLGTVKVKGREQSVDIYTPSMPA